MRTAAISSVSGIACALVGVLCWRAVVTTASSAVLSVLAPPGKPLELVRLASDLWFAFPHQAPYAPVKILVCELGNARPIAAAPSEVAFGGCAEFPRGALTRSVYPLSSVSPPTFLVVSYSDAPFVLLALGAFVLGIGTHWLVWKRQRRLFEEKERRSIDSALGLMAAQVAHDIRSPLGALQVALSDPEFTEDTRIMVRGAVKSIRGIAEGLLTKSREYPSHGTSSPLATADMRVQDIGEICAVESLPLLLEKVFAQKQAELRNRPGIEISLCQVEGAYALFSVVHSIELERIIGNLVNNAAEAIAGGRNAPSLDGLGLVSLKLAAVNGVAMVEVSDNGCGIPAEVIPRLAQRGVSFGKSGGSGLGLYHARERLESWGGRLVIESKRGEGTKVSFTIPLAEPPGWFVRALEIRAETKVVIADDDEATHALWDRRLSEAGVAPERRHHTFSPDGVVSWFRENLGTDALYVCDHEFRSDRENGLELIDRLGISKNAILVTHRADEEPIRSRCEKLGIHLLPKALIGIVPITDSPPREFG